MPMPPFRMKQRFQIGADFFGDETAGKGNEAIYIYLHWHSRWFVDHNGGHIPKGKKLQITIISFSIQTNQIPLKKIDI